MLPRTSQPTRRTFLTATGAALALASPALRTNTFAANAKLQHAAIGVAGMGRNDLRNIADHAQVEVVALCDVDANNLAAAAKLYPEARTYRDWRVLLEKEGDRVDSVNISVPDHMHAPIALETLRRRKHVYCQKPLTHEIAEARDLAAAAEKADVTTQMGNQIHSHMVYRLGAAWIRSGAIGKVKEVHSWVNAKYPRGPRPTEADEVPAHLNWDHWVGTAPMRPYKTELYHDFNWRGWQDFGTGAMGDFGCHILDPVFMALGIRQPTDVTCLDVEPAWRNDPARFTDSWPEWEKIQYTFPGTEFTAANELSLTWYDGGKQPPRELAPLPEDQNLSRSGSLFIGEEGAMMLPHYAGPRLLPLEKYQGRPKPDIAPEIDHYHTWIDHILAGKKTDCGFDYAGPLTETVLLGNVANRFHGKKLAWDAEAMKVTNHDPANALLRRDWRSGW